MTATLLATVGLVNSAVMVEPYQQLTQRGRSAELKLRVSCVQCPPWCTLWMSLQHINDAKRDIDAKKIEFERSRKKNRRMMRHGIEIIETMLEVGCLPA